jgi:homocysteine S-methyltransferase
MAEVRMSAVMTAAMLKDRAGVEPIVHISTRDRNLMALQADLMAAHAWGLRNILCIKGDPHALGSYNGAKAVWDINALDLMRILKGFNAGHDAIKKQISPATRFYVGAALNPSAPEFETELKLAKNKIRAGTDFFLTQAVFETEPVERMLEGLGPGHPPVIAGIWPVHSTRQASFLNERITQVPAWVCEAIEKAGTNAEQRGLELAQRLLEDLRPLAQGVYFVPSFGRFDGIAELVAAARQLADRRG